jgi:haloalkane dehalogenase
MTFEAAQPATADWCATHIASLETAHCGKAGHHATEDRPAEIAAAISARADRHARVAG